MNYFEGKNIVIGVTGGIAAYKSCELVRSLIKLRSDVQVVMTKNASRFITPLTLQTLSGKKVATDMFDEDWESEIGHISLADRADLVVIAPATASIIGKLAWGISDSLLTTLILATKAPVLVCPAMNVNMYENPAVKENSEKLKSRGLYLMEPGSGDLACGWEGKGRLPEIDNIVDEIGRILSPNDLNGERVLVTAGATREFIDPVRFISNPSSGKMGYSIAKVGWQRGAEVSLISGKSDQPVPYGVDYKEVQSVDEMYRAVMDKIDWPTIIVKSAAVGDYMVERVSDNKLKKSSEEKLLKLIPTKDILNEVGKMKNGKIVIGFAAETEDILSNAQSKLEKKNLDLIVANDISQEGSGFEEDTNIAYLIDKNGHIDELPKMLKTELAHKIFDKVLELRHSSNAN